MRSLAIRFEWDVAKNHANRQKHAVTFEQAARVFLDPDVVIKFDRVEDGEQRWHAIGLISGLWLMLVVHISRMSGYDEIVRIISARKANRREERIYEQQNG